MHEERAGFGPTSRVEGSVEVPASKSIAQRLLVCGALADGRTRIVRLPRSDDPQFLLGALADLGVRVTRSGPRAANLEGVPPGPHRGLSGRGNVGESGTAARLLTAVAGLCGRVGEVLAIEVEGTLRTRSSAPLFAALRRAGVGLDRTSGWPVELRPIGPPSELLLEHPVSSQEVSGLLMAVAAWPGEHLLRVVGELPSRPYLELTRTVLADFGVRVESHPAGANEEAFLLRGPLRSPEGPIAVEADASAAAVALAAGCLSGGQARVQGLGPASAQGDVAILELLAAFGCETRFEEGDLVAGGRPTRGAELDLEATPDLAPVLAAVAASACITCGAPSLLTGLGTLPGKESSRIQVLAEGLTALGLDAEAGGDRLAIRPGPTAGLHEHPRLLDPRGDHRMAFAFALLGLLREGIWVSDPGCVAKSWPSFWEDLEQAGARSPSLPYPPRP